MSSTSIENKLQEHLKKHNPFTEECHVVYLLIELRKLLDQNYPKDKYCLIRFYADWVVHTNKQFNLDDIQPAISNLYQKTKRQIQNIMIKGEGAPLARFERMEDLRDEMATLFSLHRLQEELISEGSWWLEFIDVLTKVLADQPILKPIPEVAEIRFYEAAKGYVGGVIVFTNAIEGRDQTKYDYYEFKGIL